MTREDLTVPQLKAELKARGLTIGGRKDDLIKRLLDSDSSRLVEHGKREDVPDAEPAASTPSDTEAAAPTAEVPSRCPSGEDDILAKRVKRFGDVVLSKEDRIKKREERFKTSDLVHDKDKQSARAERFGILTEDKKKEQELARAKRFNIDTPETLEEKKKARMERFSKQSAASAPALSLNELEGLIKKRSK
jgi:hypothetical protein